MAGITIRIRRTRARNSAWLPILRRRIDGRALRQVIAVANVLTAIVVVPVLLASAWLARPVRLDLQIVDATIIDGTGAAPFRGTLGVRGRRIVRIWHGTPLLPLRSKRTIDGTGLILTPGFIDTHSHADLSIGPGSGPIRADNFSGQGVTTMIVGNCGRSPADLGLFARNVDSRGSNVNIAVLAGLNTIRTLVMKKSAEPANDSQIATMCTLVDAQMAQGALGASTGYAYIPGRFASAREIASQLKVVATYRGVHASHVRDEGNGILDSVDEAILASETAGVPLVISHLKIVGNSNCSKLSALIARLTPSAVRPHRVPVFCDSYPYEASSTDLNVYIPNWFLALGHRERAVALRTERTRLTLDIAKHLRKDGFSDLSFARVAHYNPRREWQGSTLSEIDASIHPTQPSTLASQIELLLQMVEQGGAQMVYHSTCEDAAVSFQRDLLPMVGSDAAIRYDDGTNMPHPRGWGTFPRYLDVYSRKTHILPITEAIRRMTELPARVFGLSHRGRLAKGYFADLVIFDPDELRDEATYKAPFRRPRGLRYVVVNGKVVAEARSTGSGGEPDLAATGSYPGRFIRRGSALSARALMASSIPSNRLLRASALQW